jgi:hypothetical protein
VESGEPVTLLERDTGSVRSVAWHQDGRTLASGSSDGIVHLVPERYMQAPCQWLIANLSLFQWYKYRGWALHRRTCENLPSGDIPSLVDLIPFADRIAANPDLIPLLTLPLAWTLQGRLLLLGVAGLLLGLAGLMLWGSVRLVRWVIRKIRKKDI